MAVAGRAGRGKAENRRIRYGLGLSLSATPLKSLPFTALRYGRLRKYQRPVRCGAVLFVPSNSSSVGIRGGDSMLYYYYYCYRNPKSQPTVAHLT